MDDKQESQMEDIHELISQVDAFKLSDELTTPRRTKRRFLIEKLIGLPRQWLLAAATLEKVRDDGT